MRRQRTASPHPIRPTARQLREINRLLSIPPSPDDSDEDRLVREQLEAMAALGARPLPRKRARPAPRPPFTGDAA